MPDEIQIITTGDGSHSLLNTALNETYHSVHGAKRESVHVFIQHGLKYFLQHHPESQAVKIFEVGFGTGLNALLTASFAETYQKKILYTSIEAFPLAEKIWRQLNYSENATEQTLFEKLHTSLWNSGIDITAHFGLRKINTTLQQLPIEGNHFDIVFFDAFAPAKQPEMWEKALLEKVYYGLKSPGVFVTYCAKGQLKRDLRDLGFLVETLAGPPGKKEMVRALKNS